MQLNPYLAFDGQCEAAFKFYEEQLGAKIQFMLPHGEAPVPCQLPEEWRNKIMHATLALGDQTLMGADCPPGYYQKPQGISVTLGISDPKEAERVFHALAKNGTVQTPIQKTFWALRFGMVTDRFGIPWMINCTKAA
jgi:PhnB protein